MKTETQAWQNHRNNKNATIDRQFKNEDARIKLKSSIRQLTYDMTPEEKHMIDKMSY